MAHHFDGGFTEHVVLSVGEGLRGKEEMIVRIFFVLIDVLIGCGCVVGYIDRVY